MLMSHPAWDVVDHALGELESNDDLELRTARRYIIGYLLSQLIAQGVIPPAIAVAPDAPETPKPSYRWILQLDALGQKTHAKQSKRLATAK
jgi:hypothetical protein